MYPSGPTIVFMATSGHPSAFHLFDESKSKQVNADCSLWVVVYNKMPYGIEFPGWPSMDGIDPSLIPAPLPSGLTKTRISSKNDKAPRERYHWHPKAPGPKHDAKQNGPR